MAYFAPESPAGLPRNRWPLSIGISGRFGPEYALDLDRIDSETLRKPFRPAKITFISKSVIYAG